MKDVIIAAHRGDQTHYPESTLPALDTAARMGVDAVEVDLHMSRDGVVYLMHDHTVDRTTNGTGKTHELDWAYLSTLDAGSWFDPKFAGLRIPTLEEVLTWAEQYDGLVINWELKDYPHTCGEEHALRCAQQLVRGIFAHGLQGRSMINSFSSRLLEYCDKLAFHTVPIHGQGVGDTCRMFGDVTRAPESYWAWACLYNSKGGTLAEKENFDLCKSMGILPCVCLPENKAVYREAVARGCKMFTCNDPRKALEIMRELGLR